VLDESEGLIDRFNKPRDSRAVKWTAFVGKQNTSLNGHFAGCGKGVDPAEQLRPVLHIRIHRPRCLPYVLAGGESLDRGTGAISSRNWPE
jgi:hypothetical protein